MAKHPRKGSTSGTGEGGQDERGRQLDRSKERRKKSRDFSNLASRSDATENQSGSDQAPPPINYTQRLDTFTQKYNAAIKAIDETIPLSDIERLTTLISEYKQEISDIQGFPDSPDKKNYSEKLNSQLQSLQEHKNTFDQNQAQDSTVDIDPGKKQQDTTEPELDLYSPSASTSADYDTALESAAASDSSAASDTSYATAPDNQETTSEADQEATALLKDILGDAELRIPDALTPQGDIDPAIEAMLNEAQSDVSIEDAAQKQFAIDAEISDELFALFTDESQANTKLSAAQELDLRQEVNALLEEAPTRPLSEKQIAQLGLSIEARARNLFRLEQLKSDIDTVVEKRNQAHLEKYMASQMTIENQTELTDALKAKYTKVYRDSGQREIIIQQVTDDILSSKTDHYQNIYRRWLAARTETATPPTLGDIRERVTDHFLAQLNPTNQYQLIQQFAQRQAADKPKPPAAQEAVLPSESAPKTRNDLSNKELDNYIALEAKKVIDPALAKFIEDEKKQLQNVGETLSIKMEMALTELFNNSIAKDIYSDIQSNIIESLTPERQIVYKTYLLDAPPSLPDDIQAVLDEAHPYQPNMSTTEIQSTLRQQVAHRLNQITSHRISDTEQKRMQAQGEPLSLDERLDIYHSVLSGSQHTIQEEERQRCLDMISDKSFNYIEGIDALRDSLGKMSPLMSPPAPDASAIPATSPNVADDAVAGDEIGRETLADALLQQQMQLEAQEDADDDAENKAHPQRHAQDNQRASLQDAQFMAEQMLSNLNNPNFEKQTPNVNPDMMDALRNNLNRAVAMYQSKVDEILAEQVTAEAEAVSDIFRIDNFNQNMQAALAHHRKNKFNDDPLTELELSAFKVGYIRKKLDLSRDNAPEDYRQQLEERLAEQNKILNDEIFARGITPQNISTRNAADVQPMSLDQQLQQQAAVQQRSEQQYADKKIKQSDIAEFDPKKLFKQYKQYYQERSIAPDNVKADYVVYEEENKKYPYGKITFHSQFAPNEEIKINVELKPDNQERLSSDIPDALMENDAYVDEVIMKLVNARCQSKGYDDINIDFFKSDDPGAESGPYELQLKTAAYFLELAKKHGVENPSITFSEIKDTNSKKAPLKATYTGKILEMSDLKGSKVSDPLQRQVHCTPRRHVTGHVLGSDTATA